MTKSAIISPVLPPSSSGQAIVLYQLLKNHDPSKFIFLSNTDYSNPRKSDFFTNKLKTKYYYIDPIFKFKKYSILEKKLVLFLWMKGYETPLNQLLKNRTMKVANILKKEGCDSIISCTADLFGPPISYFAARLIKIPFILYAFDHYSTQWTIPLEKKFAEKYEKMICNNAEGLIVPNEFLKDIYHQLYSLDPVIIHNPCDLSNYNTQVKYVPIPRNRTIKIVYTGTIYNAHFDAFKSLLSAINRVSNTQFELHIYTNQNQFLLQKDGIRGRVVFQEYLKTDFIPKIQQEADILLLPLAFKSPYPEIIRTSSPGKMGEYLASGRPILVFAPADSYISWYFKKYQCGLVIDNQDPKELIKGLELLINDSSLQRQMVENARKRAEIDFDLLTVRKKFFKTINSMTRGDSFFEEQCVPTDFKIK